MRARPNRWQRPAQRRSRRDGAAAGVSAGGPQNAAEGQIRWRPRLAVGAKSFASSANWAGAGSPSPRVGGGGGAPERERPRGASGDERRSLLPALRPTAFQYAGGHGSDNRASEDAAGLPRVRRRSRPGGRARVGPPDPAGCGPVATRPPLVAGSGFGPGERPETLFRGHFGPCAQGPKPCFGANSGPESTGPETQGPKPCFRPCAFGAAEQEGVQGRFSVCHFFAWLDYGKVEGTGG